jgi:hypothetical protein
MTTGKNDDLEAVREIADVLKDFDDADRERILRWVREKVGMATQLPQALSLPLQPTAGTAVSTISTSSPSDIRSFVQAKQPKSDTQFAAVTAFFYRFLAPPDEKREEIGADELLDACRKAGWKRPSRVAQVLVDAYLGGLLDRATKGRYRITSIGENLVEMALPETGAEFGGGRKRAKSKGKKSKRTK